MTKEYSKPTNILAIDCCKHVISALEKVFDGDLNAYDSRKSKNLDLLANDTELIIIGVSNIPVRRLFISRMRRFYPEVPMLILRRENVSHEQVKEQIRGEFVLSDIRRNNDLSLVKTIRQILPIKLCHHTKSDYNYELVREVTRVITENHADPELNLNQVARELPISPSKLSRVLNKQVGISFRQLLKHIRIEEAKRVLASHQYSIKEVAARVGFSDSHYFSRSFKEMTGLNATEFKHNPHDLIFN